MGVTILGIRHHGVGSAKRIKSSLQRIKPDMVIVEGPPEIEAVLPYIGNKELKPPVAIMLYNSDAPEQSNFYPFAEYSPEWVAVEYALENKIPVKAMDMPAQISIRNKKQQEETTEKAEQRYVDPISYLSEIAGFENSEQWWEYEFEKSTSLNSDEQHFEAILTAMSALREQGVLSSYEDDNLIREAYMRDSIRKSLSELYENIVVVCGAWHSPALIDYESTSKNDYRLIKETPKSKIKIQVSWIPWTNSRLSMFSGYGAGITSPGWYEHLWEIGKDKEINWLTKVAEQFRKEGMDMSTAHVLEAYKLASALCIMRNKSHITLNELNEAILTVMCMGDSIYLNLIREKLVIGNKMGKVPDDIPKVPLQQSFEKTVKSLILKLTELPKIYHLDLRKTIDLERSIFFHRLLIIDIPWAKRTTSRTKGTFKESWELAWSPEMVISIIDKSYLGNTVEAAADRQVRNKCSESNKISEISGLIDPVITAELNDCIDILLNRIEELSSVSSDIVDLMKAMPDLVSIYRYGNVRKSDFVMIESILHRFFTKIFINLPNACYGLNEDHSNQIFGLISSMQNVVKIFNEENILKEWHQTLFLIVDKVGIHDIIQGCTCRLLLDAEVLEQNEALKKISYALSGSRDPLNVACWIEGFLRGSGMILIYDNRLWNILYNWVSSIDPSVFQDILPYLRRAFSRFQYGERRQIGQKAKQGLVKIEDSKQNIEFDLQNTERILKVFDTIDMLLGKNQQSTDL